MVRCMSKWHHGKEVEGGSYCGPFGMTVCSKCALKYEKEWDKK